MPLAHVGCIIGGLLDGGKTTSSRRDTGNTCGAATAIIRLFMPAFMLMLTLTIMQLILTSMTIVASWLFVWQR